MACVSELLALARAELGYREAPAGSNRTKYGAWYGLNGYPWCMMFVQWVFAQAGVPLPVRTASCGQFLGAARAAGQWVTGGYRPGDVVIYDFPGGAATDHCGIVTATLPSGVRAIEGNTSGKSDSNGGEVMERIRSNKYILGAWRPRFDGEETMVYKYLKDIPEKFRPVIGQLMTAGIIQGDGSDPEGNGDVIDLTHEQMRTLVFVYRGGGFDRKLQAAGMETALEQEV